ncbi:serine hydrolase domain-containing protein [Dactylosporangium siamense]|uniref:Lipoprotein n=1 Tax=Dactylosporangium siamense TaxID=685454 RepID=A0A919PX75_9ACTN|nr:serine hydrolase domain-containing protein [Dactylosporangium siamense]GIG50288.1 lipoprotein [Dactylosporangium siamense]
MSNLRHRTATLIRQAGYTDDQPIVVGIQQRGAPPVFSAQGSTLTASTPVYAASLAKQITAACAALLVNQGRLNMRSTLAQWLPELPGWAHEIHLRHLVHHTAGLPADDHIDTLIRTDHDRTTAGIIGALARSVDAPSTPGGQYLYSNAGYVCLAAAVERAAGQPLPEFARAHVFAPLRMNRSQYWPGPAPHPPGAAPLPDPRPAPLSLGDGGIWTTAHDLIRWNQALEADELGISTLLHTPGTLDDGTVLDYAWGLGLRTHAGRRIYRHGGGWPGLRAQLIRIPDQRSSIVILALADDTDRTIGLANALLDELNPADPILGTRAD